MRNCASKCGLIALAVASALYALPARGTTLPLQPSPGADGKFPLDTTAGTRVPDLALIQQAPALVAPNADSFALSDVIRQVTTNQDYFPNFEAAADLRYSSTRIESADLHLSHTGQSEMSVSRWSSLITLGNGYTTEHDWLFTLQFTEFPPVSVIPIVPIPEPATAMMLMAGVAGLAIRRLCA